VVSRPAGGEVSGRRGGGARNRYMRRGLSPDLAVAPDRPPDSGHRLPESWIPPGHLLDVRARVRYKRMGLPP